MDLYQIELNIRTNARREEKPRGNNTTTQQHNRSNTTKNARTTNDDEPPTATKKGNTNVWHNKIEGPEEGTQEMIEDIIHKEALKQD